MTDRRRLPSWRFAAALAAIPLVAILVADGAVLLRHASKGHHSPSATATARPTSVPTDQAERLAARARATAIHALLARRSDAVLHHDAAEWMSTVDPSQPRFRARQQAAFANLRDVPIASWSYSFDPGTARPSTRESRRYHAPVWAPATFSLHYRLRGFDPLPTNLPQAPTFVHRAGGWVLASLNDFARTGVRSSVDLWDFGPVTVVRTPSVLVLGHPGELAVMHTLASEVAADMPRVTAVWGQDWTRRVVVLAPKTQRELGLVVGDYGSLDNIAAVATAEVNQSAGEPDPVGDRIGINPHNWPKLSSLGRQIVLTHELTHIATRAVTSTSTPTWLAEGFADYIGYLGSGVPTTFVASELRADVLRGHAPASLPRDGQFAGSSKTLSQAYESGWLACQMIVHRWGQATLVRFYRAVGAAHLSAHRALAKAAERVLHLSASEFVAQWRDYVRTELA